MYIEVIDSFQESNAIPKGTRSSIRAVRNTTPRNVRSKIDDSHLQVTKNIAVRCVLHRCESQEIRC